MKLSHLKPYNPHAYVTSDREIDYALARKLERIIEAEIADLSEKRILLHGDELGGFIVCNYQVFDQATLKQNGQLLANLLHQLRDRVCTKLREMGIMVHPRSGASYYDLPGNRTGIENDICIVRISDKVLADLRKQTLSELANLKLNPQYISHVRSVVEPVNGKPKPTFFEFDLTGKALTETDHALDTATKELFNQAVLSRAMYGLDELTETGAASAQHQFADNTRTIDRLCIDHFGGAIRKGNEVILFHADHNHVIPFICTEDIHLHNLSPAFLTTGSPFLPYDMIFAESEAQFIEQFKSLMADGYELVEYQLESHRETAHCCNYAPFTSVKIKYDSTALTIHADGRVEVVDLYRDEEDIAEIVSQLETPEIADLFHCRNRNYVEKLLIDLLEIERESLACTTFQ